MRRQRLVCLFQLEVQYRFGMNHRLPAVSSPLALLGCYGFTYWVSIVLARNPIAKGASQFFPTPIAVLGPLS